MNELTGSSIVLNGTTTRAVKAALGITIISLLASCDPALSKHLLAQKRILNGLGPNPEGSLLAIEGSYEKSPSWSGGGFEGYVHTKGGDNKSGEIAVAYYRDTVTDFCWIMVARGSLFEDRSCEVFERAQSRLVKIPLTTPAVKAKAWYSFGCTAHNCSDPADWVSFGGAPRNGYKTQEECESGVAAGRRSSPDPIYNNMRCSLAEVGN